jgi:hypothetical protein
MRDGPKCSETGNANAINNLHRRSRGTRPGSKGARTGIGSLRDDGNGRTVNGTCSKIRPEAPEAIIADTGCAHQMHCRSELAMLCMRAMYGACFDTSHSLTMVRTEKYLRSGATQPVLLSHEQQYLPVQRSTDSSLGGNGWSPLSVMVRAAGVVAGQ